MSTENPVSLSEQIDFINMELRQKDIEYKVKVRRGHIPSDMARHKLSCLAAVLNTLLQLERERAR